MSLAAKLMYSTSIITGRMKLGMRNTGFFDDIWYEMM